MKLLTASLVAAVSVVAMAGRAGAAGAITVKGEVVELECSVSNAGSAHGEAHAACAMRCARRGNQMAILTANEVYLVEGDYAANNNAKLLDFVAKHIEAKGHVSERDGRKIFNVAAMMVAK